MSQEEYLSIFGAILFGLSASFYLVSWASLIQSNRFIKEWKYALWSFPFFLLTIIDWYLNWDVVSKIDTTIWYYFAGFISTGLYFVTSVIINPRKQKHIGWNYLQSRTDELILMGTLLISWSFMAQLIYGFDLVLSKAWWIPPFVLLGLWHWFKKEWISWVYLLYIYLVIILTVIQLS